MRIFDLVLPCYNESRSLPALVERAVACAKAGSLTPRDFQLVLVDNGSTDGSAAVLEALRESSVGDWIRVVKIEKNEGYGSGLLAGLLACESEFIGWTHADLQTDPADAFEALAKLRPFAEQRVLIKGRRTGRRRQDRVVSTFFALCARLVLGLPVSEINAQPKVFSSALLPELEHPPKTFAFDLYVLYRARKAGYRLIEFSVPFPPRKFEQSRWAATLASRVKTMIGLLAYMVSLARSEGRL